MKKSNGTLILTERFWPEEFGINDLAKEWKARGEDVVVLTQTPSYPFDKVYEGYQNKLIQTEQWNGIKIYRIHSLMGYKKNVLLKVMNYLFFAVYSSIIILFIRRKFNRVFVYHVGPLTQAIPALIVKKIFKHLVYIWTLDIWPDSVFAYGFKKEGSLKRFYMHLFQWFIKIVMLSLFPAGGLGRRLIGI